MNESSEEERSPAPGSRRPGGRTARTRAAVRDAVLTGLAEHGYPALTVEYVAERSGVHKTTLYRRWGGVEGMVADALALAGEDAWAAPDTGSLAGDLRALALEVTDAFADPAQAAAPTAFVGAAFQSERAAESLRDFYTERFRRCEPVVDRAVARGEAPAGTDPGAVVRAVSAPLFLRLFVTREPVDARAADEAARTVLAAVEAGAFVPEPDAPPQQTSDAAARASDAAARTSDAPPQRPPGATTQTSDATARTSDAPPQRTPDTPTA